MDKETIDKLAKLARIDITDEEAENLALELGTILKYVGGIKGVQNKQETTNNKQKENFPNRNIMREDDNAHEGGLYTEDLIKSAPRREGDYVKVKKIL